jgi:Zn-dependent protease with chaperone function
VLILGEPPRVPALTYRAMTPAEPQEEPAPLIEEARAAYYEGMAREHPARYRRTLAGLAVLGYAYVVFVLAVLVGSGLLLLRLRFFQAIIGGLAALYAAAKVLRSLWVRRAGAEGLPIVEADAPALFAAIERLRGGLGCRTPRSVHLTVECNASVDPTRWGRRAGPMAIGLPLLLALTPEEAEAVIAHELGHVANTQGAFSLWIYRVHATWARLGHFVAPSGGAVTFLLDRFARWYFPRFAVCAQVFSRAFERHADREAARLTRPEALASALARIDVTDAWLNETFWPDVARRARGEADPAAGLFSRLTEALARPDPERERRLGRALALRTMYWDTHPSLAERVAALGVPPPALAPVGTSAAAVLLGPSLDRLCRATERAWFATVEGALREHRTEVGLAEERLSALEASPSGACVEDAWERASLTEQLHGPGAAEPLYRQLLADQPTERRAQLALGEILLGRAAPEGEDLVRQALADPWLAPHAYGLLFSHLAGAGKHDEAERMHRLAAAHQDALEAAGPERSVLARGDVLLPHGLDAEEVERVRGQLVGRPDLAEAYLLRKQVRHFPEKPCFVLAFVARVPWYRLTGPGFGAKLAGALASEVRFREPILVVPLNEDRALLKKVRAVQGARIFDATPVR